MKKIEPFGYLMTLDCYGCKKGICDDLAFCYSFLEDLVVELGVSRQSPPFIFKSDEIKYPDKAGLSGWIPLIESGIQIHTLTQKNFISIDIYSCRYISSEHIEAYVRNSLCCIEIETNYVERGIKYNDIQ